jgi:hypothetical protein
MNNLPKIIMREKAQEKIDKLEKLVSLFKKEALDATKPFNCCGRRTSCFLFFKGIFGTLD